MKKLFLSIAFVLGTIVAINAQEVKEVNSQQNVTTVAQQDDVFKPVKLEELSEKVQLAIAALGDKYEFSAFEFDAKSQISKVEGIDKVSGEKKVIYFDAEGKEIKPEKKEAKDVKDAY